MFWTTWWISMKFLVKINLIPSASFRYKRKAEKRKVRKTKPLNWSLFKVNWNNANNLPRITLTSLLVNFEIVLLKENKQFNAKYVTTLADISGKGYFVWKLVQDFFRHSHRFHNALLLIIHSWFAHQR